MASPNTSVRPVTPYAGPAGLVLALACAGQFMVILDASIVNVALTSIQRDLGFAATGVAWVVNGYLLTFAGLLLLGGRAVDAFRPSRMMAAGLLVFSAASLAAGLAGSPGVLVAARAVQGVGAAVLAPATLAVINTGFPGERARARAFGAWSASGGVGGMAGAIAGGAITTGLSWRWVFLLNVPIGVVLTGLAAVALAGSRTGRREPLDLAGAVTGTAGLGVLVYGVMGGAEHRWTSGPVAGPIAAGLLLLAVFAVVETRVASRPLVPPRLFTVRTVAVGNGLLVLFGGIVVAMWYFTSLLLQNVLGYSALHAGLGQTPAAVAFTVVARSAGAVLARTGVRKLLVIGCAGFVAGFGWLAGADAGTGYLAGVLGPTLLVAAGLGLVFPTLVAAATAGVPERDAGIAGGLANAAGQVGASVGLAVLASVASSRAAAAGAGSPADAFAAGYDLVFRVAAGLALVIALAGLLLPRHRPE